jgi:hypothetical protein
VSNQILLGIIAGVDGNITWSPGCTQGNSASCLVFTPEQVTYWGGAERLDKALVVSG